MSDDNKYINGVPQAGVADELPEEDRGGGGTYKWLQLRSFWGHHPQRNEVRVLDEKITLTDTFCDDGRLKGGKLPDKTGKGQRDAFEQGMFAAMVVGILSIAVGGFALTKSWFQAYAFEFPEGSGNTIDAGQVAGTAVIYGLIAVVVFALAMVARSFLKDRGISRAADTALTFFALVVILVSFANLGGDNLAPTLDLVDGWDQTVSEKAKERAKAYVEGGPLGAELEQRLKTMSPEVLRILVKEQKLEPRRYKQRQEYMALDQPGLVAFLMTALRKKTYGGDRCGERDERGNRIGVCDGLSSMVAQGVASADAVAAEIRQIDTASCMLDKNEVESWLAERRGAKVGSRAPPIPGSDCQFSLGKHDVGTKLDKVFDEVRAKAWSSQRAALAKQALQVRLALERRELALKQVVAGSIEGHSADEDAITKQLTEWATAAKETFVAREGEKRRGIEIFYAGGIGCYWLYPTDDEITAAKEAKEPKPEPKAICSDPSRDHAEYAVLAGPEDYKTFRIAYGDATQKRTHHPKDPAAKPPQSEKPEPPDLNEEDRRTLQIAAIDLQDDLEVSAKDLETIVAGLEKRSKARPKVFTAVTVSDAGSTVDTRQPFFVSQGEWLGLVAEAEKAEQATGPLGITCKKIEIEEAAPAGSEKKVITKTKWNCIAPQDLEKTISGVNADLLVIWRVYKHKVNGPTLQAKIIDKKTGYADYSDAQMVGDLAKITQEAGHLLDRLVLAWAMNQRRKAHERARASVNEASAQLRDRLNEAAGDLSRTDGAYNYATNRLLSFSTLAATDAGAALEKHGADFLVERRSGYFWIMLGMIICLLGLGINRSTREVGGETLVRLTGDGADVRLNLASAAPGGLAIWDGNEVLTGGALGDRGSSDSVQLRDREAAAFSIGGIAYTVRYISTNLDVPPGEFEEPIPDAALLAAIPAGYQPSDQISPGVFVEPDAQVGGPDVRRLEVRVFWGLDLFATDSFAANKQDILIGTGAKADIDVSDPLFGEIGTNYTLVSNDAGTHTINVPDGANCEAMSGGELHKKDALVSSGRLSSGSLKLNEGEVVAIKAGALTVVLRYVATDTIPVVPFLQRFDWLFANIAAASLLLHLALIAIFILTPVDPNRLSEDLFKNPNRFVEIILKEPEKKEKKKEKLDLSGAKDGGKHKDKEGKFGKKDKPKKDALASKKGAPTVDPNKRERDRKIAFKAGLLGLTGANAAVSNVFGPGGLGTGINNALGGLRGSEFGDAGGAGGLGYRGTGAGGGGNALGIGGLGSGTGRGTGGLGSVDLGGRGRGTTRILPGRTIIKGSLSKEEIARVIRRHLNQIKYCYEKELNKKPNLKGKVTVKFIIAGTGRVKMSKVYQTTMNHGPTESCINRIVKMMKFPQPRGGGIVQVVYPFMFQKSG